MSAQVLYGARGGSATTSDLYTVDPATAATTSVGPIGYALSGLAFDPTDGTLFGVTSNNSTASPRYLIQVDPVTGAGTPVGPLNMPGGEAVVDICINSAGHIFGWGSFVGGVITIDKTTGQATRLITESTFNGGGLEFVLGVLYHIPPGNAQDILTIDPVTGVSTVVGTFSNPASGTTNAAAYNPVTATLYITQSTTQKLATVNLATGVATVIASISPATFDAIAWSLSETASNLWTIEHYEHEFTAVVVGDPEIEANGALVNTVAPENLHFVWQLAELGPSEVDYEISNTAEDLETSLGIVQWDFVRPYFHDFTLKRNGQEILAGPITSLNIEAGAEHVKIGGKDWMHYLERRMWPYDADLSYVNWPSGFRFKVSAAEVGQIVTDILETVRDVSGNFPGPPNDATFPSYSLKFTVDCDDTGTTRNYEISPFETSSVYDLIRSLSQMDTDNGGFDFFMTPARPPDIVFRLFYPESGDPGTPIFTIEIDDVTAIANALEVGYTDSGPGASHVLGVGSGTATRAGGVNKHLRIVSARTRRLDTVGDYGDVKNLPTLESKTLAQLNHDWRSIHEIPILVDPADIPDFWTITSPGAYINVDYDLKGHRINSIQKIVSMDVTVDLEGNERVLFGLNQHVEGGSTDVASDP